MAKQTTFVGIFLSLSHWLKYGPVYNEIYKKKYIDATKYRYNIEVTFDRMTIIKQ